MTNVSSSSSIPLLKPIRSWQSQREVDVVIIGAGIAGLAMALRLPEDLRIAVVTKGVLGESNTRYAQGGFAAPIGADDDIELHIADTLAAGAGLSDEPAVRTLISGASSAAAWLIAQGTSFDREDGELTLGREAAHSRRRILHAGGDATGAEIERALVAQLRARPSVTILDLTTALDLVLDESGRCRGVIVNQSGRHEFELLAAREVVLANGGAGQLWAVTSNPPGATGDGMAMAIRAGATLADLEFAQFHPTVLAVPGAEGFLISEAVRGEGAWLRSRDGSRFMLAIDPRAELAPRDVVARAIQHQMSIDGTTSVNLDLRHLDPELVRRRFPTISAHLKALGLDLATDLIPVAPASHYFMGGIAADPQGETSIPGLRAIGEVSCTGVHGANRLASNSLLEGLVFGLQAADAIAAQRTFTPAVPLIPETPTTVFTTAEIGTNDEETALIRRDIQRVMSENVAVVRSAETLNAAEDLLARIAERVASFQTLSPGLLELRNMVILAQAITTSAAFREESRGGHFRSDDPDRDPNLDGMHQLVRHDGSGFVRTFAALHVPTPAIIGA